MRPSGGIKFYAISAIALKHHKLEAVLTCGEKNRTEMVLRAVIRIIHHHIDSIDADASAIV